MKKILLIYFLFSFTGNCFAQITFQKGFSKDFWFPGFPYGFDNGYSVKQTYDGGYIIAGVCGFDGNSTQDIILIKTDGYGDTLWTRTYGGTENDIGYSVQQTTDSGYVISGSTDNTLDLDLYLIKTDANGDTLWTRTFDNYGNDVGYSVVQANDGGFVVAGWTGIGTRGYLIKTDINGDTLWTRALGENIGFWAYAVQQTTDGGYIISGVGILTSPFTEACLIKTDSSGIPVWTKTYGGIHGDEGLAVQQTTDGGYIITGYTWSFFGALDNDVYLIKTNDVGDTLWTKIYGGSDSDAGYSVQQTSDGGYIVAGLSTSFSNNIRGLLIKTDSNGDTLWTRIYTEMSANSVLQTTDGGYIVAGDGISLFKTDANGNSDCDLGGTTSFVLSPPTQVGSPVISLSSGNGSIVTPYPYTIVGSGDSISTICILNGVNQISNPELPILISPNPSPGNFTITFTNAINDGEVQIFNPYGSKIFTQNIQNTSNTEIHLDNIPAGIYFVKVWDGEKYLSNKIIIQQN